MAIRYRLARHLGDALHEVLLRQVGTVRTLIVVGLDLVARGDLPGAHGLRRGERVNHPEIQPGGLLHLVEHVRIVLGVDIGELDLDPVGPDRADQGLGHAHRVDARADDVDRLGELLLAGRLLVVASGLRPQIGLKRKAHAALEVQAHLQTRLGAVE